MGICIQENNSIILVSCTHNNFLTSFRVQSIICCLIRSSTWSYFINSKFEKEIIRFLNEEKNQGNVHKDCKWYNEEKDYCSNYMMGVYTGLAFEVSRHNKCIKELIKDDKK